MKLNPDSILSLPGIGPKAFKSIEEALSKISFQEPEAVVEEPTAVEAEVPAVEAPAAEEVPAEVKPAEEAAVPAEETPEKVEEGPKEGEEQEFEKIFSLQNIMSTTPTAEDTSEERGKKKDKKVKKGRELEFDEKRGEVVAKKKHKRGDGVLGEEWEE